jgi:hypothetical protein
MVVPFPPFSSRGKALLSFLGLCLLNGMMALGSAPSSSYKMAPSNDHGSTSSNPSKVASQTEVGASGWSYDTSADEMTGASNRYACTKSTNELQFSFPYSGGATGRLCFRRKGKSLNAFVQMSSGQFNCGIESCGLKLKFDNGPIQSFSGDESSTHETGFLFIEPEQKLLSATLKAKQLKLQAEFFQEGRKVLNFDVAGLDAKRL